MYKRKIEAYKKFQTKGKEIRKLLFEEQIDTKINISIDEMTDISFRIAGIGEEAGFIRGFQYAVKLLTECV